MTCMHFLIRTERLHNACTKGNAGDFAHYLEGDQGIFVAKDAHAGLPLRED